MNDSCHRIICKQPLTTELELANQITDPKKNGNALARIALLLTDYSHFEQATTIADTISDLPIRKKLLRKILHLEQESDRILNSMREEALRRSQERGEDSDDNY
jgi:hypothetical protein